MNNILVYGVIGVYLLICLVWGLLRGLSKTRFRSILILISAALAVAVTFAVKGALVSENFMQTNVRPYLLQLGEEVAGVLDLSPSLRSVLFGCAGALTAPFVLVAAFLVISVATWIVFFLITVLFGRAMRKRDREAPLKGIRTTFWVLIHAAVVVAVFLTPVTVYMDCAPALVEAAEETEALDAGTMETVDSVMTDFVEPLSQTPVISVYRQIGGAKLCVLLTDFKVDEETVHLKDELSSVATFAGNVYNLSKSDIEAYGEREAAVIIALADSFEGSAMLPKISGELIYAATEKWIAEEEFFGVARPELGETIDPVFTVLLSIMHDDSQDLTLLREDFRTLAEMVGIFARHGVFASLSDTDALMSKLGADGVVAELITELGSNGRMSALIDEIYRMGMRAIANTLGIPEDIEGIYNDFLDDLATALNSTKGLGAEERLEALTGMVGDAFAEAGVEIDTELIGTYSVAFLADLGDLETVTPDFVREFFAAYAIATDEEAPGTAKNPNGIDTIAYTEPLADEILWTCPAYRGKTVEEIKSSTGAGVLRAVTEEISGIEETDPEEFAKQACGILEERFAGLLGSGENAEVMLNAVKEANVKEIKADMVANTQSLKAADEMKSSIVTLKDLTAQSSGGRKSEAEIAKDAAAIQNIFNAAGDLMGEGADLSDVGAVAGTVGSILNSLSETSSFGSEKTADLFVAVLQSEKVRESAGLDIRTATKLGKAATEGEPDYEKTMNVVAASADVVASLNSEITSVEDVEKLLNNMTPQVAGMIREFVTAERLAGYGLPEEKSQSAAEIIGGVFSYLADTAMDEAAFENEKNAIVEMMNIARAATVSTGSKLFGEGGRLPEASALVNTVMKSGALRDTVLRSLTKDGAVTVNDPFGIAGSLAQDGEDAQAVLNAVTAYRNNHEKNDETDLELKAVGALLGFEINFDD